MKHLVVLISLCALSAGQVLRAPSSFKNGIKWEFGSNIILGDVLTRSNVDQEPAVPTVYKKELVARREPVVAVYKKPSVVPDVYKPVVVPTVYKKEPVVQNVRHTHHQQSVVPPVVGTHSVHSNIYKNVPVVQNVYKQQPTVPIVRKTHPAVLNVHQFKSQPVVEPVVHEVPPLLQDFVPKVLPVNSQKNHVQRYSWN